MITLENVSKTYGNHVALAPLTLHFPARQTTALIGESGSGKSTLLRLLLGLIVPDSGTALFDGVALDRSNRDEIRHRVGYVIQDGGLFPHLTAEANVTLLARHLRRDPEWIGGRIAALAELVHLSPETLHHYPRQLSGGQRQRVGLMRALVLDPDVLLLDEPLGALDPVTRFGLQQELKTIFATLGKTVVMVTHDVGEAAYFSDSLVLLRGGKVVQRGSVADFLERPADPYVTQFVRAQRGLLAETAR
ncbi:MAG TPA: ATP-binding cassette domain-containing protein [Burkholderiales bacterium]|nr:ATP-binding cassette domain-containing protein [Burkholderiales bacterium]